MSLKQIEEFINASGYQTHYQEKTAELPHDIAWINLGQDLKQRDRVLQIALSDQLMPSDTSVIDGVNVNFLHFFATFPFTFRKELFPEAARLVCLLNKATPLAPFNLSEIDKTVNFHYTLASSHQELDRSQIDFIMSAVIYAYEVFAPLFEDLAEGKQTFEDILKNASEELPEE